MFGQAFILQLTDFVEFTSLEQPHTGFGTCFAFCLGSYLLHGSRI